MWIFPLLSGILLVGLIVATIEQRTAEHLRAKRRDDPDTDPWGRR